MGRLAEWLARFRAWYTKQTVQKHKTCVAWAMPTWLAYRRKAYLSIPNIKWWHHSVVDKAKRAARRMRYRKQGARYGGKKAA